MKRALFIFIFILFLGQELWAQERQRFDPDKIQPKWALKINVLSGFAATINISAERLPQQRRSYQNGVFYTHAILSGDERKPGSIQAIGDVFDIRKYRKNSPQAQGRYHMVFARVAYLDIHDFRQDSLTQNKIIKLEERMSGLALGYCIGYQKIYKKRFVLDVFAGLSFAVPISYYSSLSKEEIKQYDLNSWKSNPLISGLGMRAGIKAGYLF